MRPLLARHHVILLSPRKGIQNFTKGPVIDGAGDRCRVLPLRIENDPALQAPVERPLDVEADQLAAAERDRRLVDRHLDNFPGVGVMEILRHQEAGFLRNGDDDGNASDLFRHDLPVAVLGNQRRFDRRASTGRSVPSARLPR